STGRRGVKEKQQVLANNATKDTVKVASSPGVDEHVVVDGNTKGIEESVNFRTLTAPVGNGADVAIPLESIRAISECLAQEWIGCNAGDGVSVWIKFHGVLMMAFSEDGLSIIATKLCTPLMLDSYTFDIRMQSWGRSSYARALIDLRADEELKDSIVVAMPKLIGEGFNMCFVCVEYEWKPPKCSCCKVYGHVLNECHKKIVSNVVKNLNNVEKVLEVFWLVQ
nr:hypothetical protein [Tanacetum cinerariifolium]